MSNFAIAVILMNDNAGFFAGTENGIRSCTINDDIVRRQHFYNIFKPFNKIFSFLLQLDATMRTYRKGYTALR